MSLILVFMLVLMIAAITTVTSFWLLAQAHEHPPSDWVVVHVVSPVFRTISLIVAISLVFPVLFPQTSVGALWQMLSQNDHFSTLLNSLFFASLFMSLLPILGHPLISMPLQACLGIAVVFDWAYKEQITQVSWLPDWTLLLKLLLAMLVIFFVGHRSAVAISRYIDETWHLSGSIQLVADAVYLPLLIPVMIIYGNWLTQQLPLTAVL